MEADAGGPAESLVVECDRQDECDSAGRQRICVVDRSLLLRTSLTHAAVSTGEVREHNLKQAAKGTHHRSQLGVRSFCPLVAVQWVLAAGTLAAVVCPSAWRLSAMYTSASPFSVSSFATIPPTRPGKPLFLPSPHLLSPFQLTPTTPLPQSASSMSSPSHSSTLRMLDVRTEDEVFDLAFHPTQPLFVAGLITGELQMYRMDGRPEQEVKSRACGVLRTVKENEEEEEDDEEENVYEGSFDESGEDEGVVLKPAYLAAPTLLSTSCPHTASIRSLAFSTDGSRLYSASSDQSISTFALNDTELRPVDSIPQAHGCAINVVKVGSGDREGQLATGDDDGYVKVWDTRQHNRAKQPQPQPARQPPAGGTGVSRGQKRKRRKTGKPVELKVAASSQSTAVMSFAESGDYISDLLMSDSHLLLSSSGDGHLQVFDLRRAGSWYAQSEAVDDDLLSLCCVVKKRGKGSVERRRKVLVGSKESGVHVYSWDWFGRPDEHFAYPESADCIAEVDTPATTANVIAIGSSEGSLGLCTLWPHTLHRTIGRHAGGQPVEAVRLSGRVRVRSGVGGVGGGWVDVEEGGERDSRWLVSAGHDKRIRMWDVTSVCEEGVKQEEEDEESEEEEEEEEEEDDVEAEKEADVAGVQVSQGESSEQAGEVAQADDSDECPPFTASKLAVPSAGDLDRAAAVAALKRKIAAAKQHRAVQRKAAGRAEDDSSSDENDSDEDGTPHSNRNGVQQVKRKVVQQQQPKKKGGSGDKAKAGFFDGL